MKQVSIEASEVRSYIVKELKRAGGAHTTREISELAELPMERTAYALLVLASEDRVTATEVEGRRYYEVKR